MVRAGQHRHRVTLQKDAGEGSYDSRGQVTHDWQDEIVLWVQVVTLTGREAELARQTFASASVEIRTRFVHELGRDTAAVRKRFRHTDRFGTERIYNIGHIENVDQRDAELRLLCSQEV